ncbi:MAG: DUF1446 domain-containing protein [Candidatus Hydrogenedentes bacterium]|nr:DUF1446 domain-containing protein [Candidatus Hydrogenedentota bacterium]MBI3118272.1 DUF1446 domain-containing protein [Candidatus Hydrogenedentota bacterium]
MPTITIGNAQGFWGDQPDAPARLLEQYPALDFLTLDYLAEVSMSILALQREREPHAGYARDFVDVVRSLAPAWRAGSRLRVVCNAGGLNPEACAQACGRALAEAGVRKRIGIVRGDDVLDLLRKNPGEASFRNLESGRPLREVADRLITANAYIGGRAVARALDQGADIVISGRVADPSLTVGICVHAFGWSWTDYARLANATVGGHIIECGAQATGGIATHWLEVPEPGNVGFPVLEVNENADLVVTKPRGTGGEVSLRTVKEQLLYEIGDPKNYLSPDCRVDFSTLRVAAVGPDRVSVTGAGGSAPPDTFKVSATYRDGYSASGSLTIFGRDALAKARRSGEIILERLRRAGLECERSEVEYLGANAAARGILSSPVLLETVLRISVADPRREVVERFTRELAALITGGPQGLTGYAAGRPGVHPVFAFWPCLVSRERVIVSTSVSGGG